MRWPGWLLTDRRDDLLRVLVLGLVCLGLGMLAVDYGSSATERLEVGDIAPRTVKAPRSFSFQDPGERARRQEAASAAVLPVYVHRRDVREEQLAALQRAFSDAREDLREALSDQGLDPQEVPPAVDKLPRETRESVRAVFRSRLGVAVPDRDIDVLMAAGFPPRATSRAAEVLGQAFDGLVIGDRDDLPADRGPMTLVEIGGATSRETILRDYANVVVPEEVRREMDVRASMSKVDAPWGDAAVRVARALVRPNLRADVEATEARRSAVAQAVPPVEVFVKRGTVLFRDGEELTAEPIQRYNALQGAPGAVVWLEVVAIALFFAFLVFTLVHFGAGHLRRFSMSLRDVTAVAVLLLLVGVMARIGVGVSDGVATVIGMDADPRAVWFAVPVAGAAMLVRLLVGVNWAMLTAAATAAVCGLLMDLDALMVLFAVVSSVVAAGSVHNTRERMSVLRAGLAVGVANAAMALLIHFLGGFMGPGATLGAAVTLQPVWAMVFGFLGGILSSFLVLGLMPLFETAGFVTDYRLMELANLNHPLMKQLMLRAPGSYHHSVVVGSLAEAACEEIGANALQTRVAAYFHDIGKALKPHYFVENQGSGGNKHLGLDPYTSAAIIISHVTEGAELARQHRLPKPCVDNIYMHHGTGLLQYFYARALEQADGDQGQVDERAFRYPGPRPDSKESGILMLADKVEAATRTIAEPNEEKFRSMIHAIINSVMADNQFEHCPLTFQELYRITDAFVGVLNGIHHQRIEYPQTAHLSAARKDVPPPPRKDGDEVITLEIPTQARLRSPTPVPGRAATAPAPPETAGETTTLGDYEAVEHLPGERQP